MHATMGYLRILSAIGSSRSGERVPAVLSDRLNHIGPRNKGRLIERAVRCQRQ